MSQRSDRRAEIRREEIRARRAAQRRGELPPAQSPRGRTPKRKPKKKVNLFRVGVIGAGVALAVLLMLGIVNAVRGASSSAPPEGNFFATVKPVATPDPSGGESQPDAPADTTPFAGALFVGDSMTAPLKDYVSRNESALSKAKFATADGYSWKSIASEQAGAGTLSMDGASMTLSEAVAATSATKLYIMLGKNDLVDMDAATAAQNAQAALTALTTANPALTVTVHAVTPMLQDISYEGLNNTSIAAFNKAMETYCATATACTFLNVAEAFPGGVLPFDDCADTTQLCIHLNDSGCEKWAAYLLGERPAANAPEDTSGTSDASEPSEPSDTSEPGA